MQEFQVRDSGLAVPKQSSETPVARIYGPMEIQDKEFRKDVRATIEGWLNSGICQSGIHRIDWWPEAADARRQVLLSLSEMFLGPTEYDIKT